MPTDMLNWNTTPPGLWRFRIGGITDPAIAWVKDFYAYNDLEKEIVRRMKSNGITTPNDLRQQVVDQICATLPEGSCSNGSVLSRFGSAISHEFARVVQGTTTLVDWWVNDGRSKVSLAEANRRASICAGCVFNVPPAGCTNCNKGVLAELANRVVNGLPTEKDANLAACSICGCELKAKVWLPLPTLQRHLTAAQMAQFPPSTSSFKGCWLRADAKTS